MKTHHADDETLEYIASLEQRNAELLAALEALLISEDDTKPGARERHAEKRKQARAAIAKTKE
jgi:hypothetical protein